MGTKEEQEELLLEQSAAEKLLAEINKKLDRAVSEDKNE